MYILLLFKTKKIFNNKVAHTPEVLLLLNVGFKDDLFAVFIVFFK
jgi:hypothetical protein